MEVNKKIFIIEFIITVLILVSILFSNSILNDKREQVLMERMDLMVEEYEDMQALLFMSDFFGEEATCLALENVLEKMNKEVWTLGGKLDSYRQATEGFMRDPFYQKQKETFNRKEVLYFSVLQKMQSMCPINQTIISFFYRKKDFCPDCDAQSFVISDIKHDLEKVNLDHELPVFSFDADTNIASISLLTKYYGVDSFPCIVVGDRSYCGLHDKEELLGILCANNSLSIC